MNPFKGITADEIIIQRVIYIELLGIIIDGNLSWNVQVNFVCDSLIKFFAINHNTKQLKSRATVASYFI